MSEPAMPDPITQELANLKSALDQSAIVAITDAKGLILHVNDKFCEISGYSRQELLGKTHRIINSGHHPQVFFAQMWKTIAQGLPWQGEICNRAKNGNLYWVSTSIIPFLNSLGKPDKYIAIRFEITQRKQQEEELAKYANQLEAKNKELQDFASVAAHDLQEPLRKVRAFTDRITTKFGAGFPSEALDYFSRIQSATSRMQKLIDDLLAYSRITTQSKPFQSIDMNLCLQEVLEDLEHLIEKTGAKIQVEPILPVFGDPTQVRQIFQNLIANAIKFQNPESGPPLIHIRQPNASVITIQDNGIGFDMKYLPKIFTIFQRLHNRQEFEGTGVGLAICRRIMERHHGQIWAESSPGQGAIFYLQFPPWQEHQPPSPS